MPSTYQLQMNGAQPFKDGSVGAILSNAYVFDLVAIKDQKFVQPSLPGSKPWFLLAISFRSFVWSLVLSDGESWSYDDPRVHDTDRLRQMNLEDRQLLRNAIDRYLDDGIMSSIFSNKATMTNPTFV